MTCMQYMCCDLQRDLKRWLICNTLQPMPLMLQLVVVTLAVTVHLASCSYSNKGACSGL